jgi:hypothetical protein
MRFENFVLGWPELQAKTTAKKLLGFAKVEQRYWKTSKS